MRSAIQVLIHDLFGYKVCHIVLALTRAEDISYSSYIEMIPVLCPDAVPVKLADLEDNLDPVRALLYGPIPETLRQRYEWAKEYLESCMQEGCLGLSGSRSSSKVDEL